MIRWLFETFTRAARSDITRLRSLPTPERTRVVQIFNEAKKLDLNSSPESLREMMR